MYRFEMWPVLKWWQLKTNATGGFIDTTSIVNLSKLSDVNFDWK